jgi:hypothetical protein
MINLLEIGLLLLLTILGGWLVFLSNGPALRGFPVVRVCTFLFGVMLFIGVGWCVGIALGVLK